MHRSVYDYAVQKKWWYVEWKLTTWVDSGDYKEDYANWVSPWVNNKYLSITGTNAELWEWGPTTSTGSWSYSLNQFIRIGPSGPTVGFGVSNSWSKSNVKINDETDPDRSWPAWQEYFPPDSGAGIPDYWYYPFYMTPPIDASHYTYYSHRSALFHHSPTSSFNFDEYCRSSVKYDSGFWFFFLLHWTRTTVMHSSGVVGNSYPATGS